MTSEPRIIAVKPMYKPCAVCGVLSHQGAIDLDLPGYICGECLSPLVYAANLLSLYLDHPDEKLIRKNP